MYQTIPDQPTVSCLSARTVLWRARVGCLNRKRYGDRAGFGRAEKHACAKRLISLSLLIHPALRIKMRVDCSVLLCGRLSGSAYGLTQHLLPVFIIQHKETCSIGKKVCSPTCRLFFTQPLRIVTLSKSLLTPGLRYRIWNTFTYQTSSAVQLILFRSLMKLLL
jgi:hypothetical protein